MCTKITRVNKMIINVLGNEYDVESWWRWVSVDNDGEVCLFYDKPVYGYWNGYGDGRFWATEDDTSKEWKSLGFVEKDCSCLIYIGDEK